MQLVHAWIRLGVPSTSARTRWTFGSHRRLIRLWENVTDFPNHGFLPHTSQTAAIGVEATRGRSADLRVHSRVGETAWRFFCRVASKSSPGTVETNVPARS